MVNKENIQSVEREGKKEGNRVKKKKKAQQIFKQKTLQS